MTATSSPAEPPESTLAAVLGLHHAAVTPIGDGLEGHYWTCTCGARESSGLRWTAMAAMNKADLHVAAAILAATPTAARHTLDGGQTYPAQVTVTNVTTSPATPSRVAELEAALAAAEASRSALRSALERTEHRFVAAVAGRPVRDMAETLAENAAALTPPQPAP